MPTLKTKVKAQKKNKLDSYWQKEAEFLGSDKPKDLLYPSTDSEIDEVYGPGSATRALDEVYEKMKKK